MEMVSLQLQLFYPLGKIPATQWTEGREPNKDGNNDINYIYPFNINQKHVYVHGW